MCGFSAKRWLIVLFGCVVLAALFCPPLSGEPAPKTVLVISTAVGGVHSSAILGERIIAELGAESGSWQVDFARTEADLSLKMTPVALRRYAAVVFDSSSGDLKLPDRQAFLDWVKAGGGVAGLHAATHTFHGWDEYIDMIGGELADHGYQDEVEFIVEDPDHPATRGLPWRFRLPEEIYIFQHFSREKVRVLVSLDKHPNTGIPGDYPVSWVRNYGKGRVFYTSLGHREDILGSDLMRKHLLGGIRWVLGLEEGSAEPLPAPSPVTQTETREGFRPLFNGKDLSGWHLRREDGTAQWKVANGMLYMTGGYGVVPGHGGSDLISDEEFGDFILRFEYMVPERGNSGVYLRGRYEVQILDDYESKRRSTNSNGAIYGKIAPDRFASLPPGEWQSVEVKLVSNRVTVTLNGMTIIDDKVIEGPTLLALDDRVGEPGPIMLEGGHGPIAFRNIRIRPLLRH